MPLNLMSLTLVDAPVTHAEGLKILERDKNALVMRVDFVLPRAHKGKKDPKNLVACCTPCNTIKGTKVYASFADAKKHVLERREEFRKAWEVNRAKPLAKAAKA